MSEATAQPVPQKTLIVLDPFYKEHDTGPGHPEAVERYEAVVFGLRESGLLLKTDIVTPRDALEDDLLMVHAPKYLKIVREDTWFGAGELSTGDVVLSPRSLDVALRAAGAGLTAVDAVMAKKHRNAFCVVRPPGHHATPVKGMGFCIFNNIAIAARYAQKKHKVGKVAIIDWDVHHGNGTQDTFYDDDSVLFFSVHQYPWYPGTGADAETGTGRGLGYTVNVPLPAMSSAKQIVPAFTDILGSKINKFRPDLILVSAGFDSRVGDPLGRFRLTDDDFVTLTDLVKEWAHDFCEGRIVSMLEGGYNLDGVAKGTRAHVGALIAP